MSKNQISRRTFVKGLAAGAASIATLGVLQGVEYSMQNKPAGGGAAITPAVSNMTYTPGTYSASARGINSDVTVTMTFDEHSITDVQIDASGETPDIGGKIVGEMQQKILSAQSCDVDGVSSATITADAIKTAAADCISQASGQTVTVGGGDSGGGSDWLGEAPEIAESDITETLDTEVLVVGCGSGGWITAMTAAEEGAKVLVLEKREKATGIRHDIGAINSKIQLAEIQERPELHIDKMEALQEIVRYGAGYVDSDLIKVWINESGEMVDWLTDILDRSGQFYMSLEGGVGDLNDPGRDKAYASGHSPHKKEEFADNKDISTESVFQAHCDELGVEWKLSTAMIKLEQDGSGKVTGVIAQDQNDQHYIRVNASKGVIMCAGGYASNTEMMLALQPMTMDMKINCAAGSTSDGAGIKAMMWAGAQLDPTHASMMFNRCCCLPTETAGYKTNGKRFWIGEQPFLKVNLNGQRFCNESGPYEFMLHSMWMQPYHTYCDIFDGNNKQYCEQFDEVGCCRLFPFPNGALSNNTYESTWADTEKLIEEGYVQKADTLEELAEKLNIPVDNFLATVQRYNELCAKGVDEDYGKERHRMTPVDTAPFYGTRTGAWHLTTLNGCRINTDMQVIDEAGNPIEGLYATGDCTGGFFAHTYPNLFTGLACGRTMTFGRRAAKLVAAR
ncbi:MAG: FAD-dependent oxidoreductase [Oscillospiraceae bacterium]|nr:FAD-dependent oxidoreductase [Oscillospiraceae bacterium]